MLEWCLYSKLLNCMPLNGYKMENLTNIVGQDHMKSVL